MKGRKMFEAKRLFEFRIQWPRPTERVIQQESFCSLEMLPSAQKDYHENVAQASSLHGPHLQARCLRYVFIMLGRPSGHGNSF
jgi:hypothetical protein